MGRPEIPAEPRTSLRLLQASLRGYNVVRPLLRIEQLNTLPFITDPSPVDPATCRKAGVLFILGSVRSGSTLLDMLLGLHPEISSTGELHCLWEYWNDCYKRPSLCTCGEHVHDCPFWRSVVRRLESHHRADMTRFVTRIGFGDSRRIRWRELLERFRAKDRGDQSDAAENSFTVADAIADTHHVSWIVDSSKHPARALGYRQFREPNRPLKLIFLLRQPLGSAYSIATRGKISLTRAALAWMKVNLQCGIAFLRFPADAKLLVRYEDLCSDPEGTLARIHHMLSLPASSRVPGEPSHNLGGSPGRHSFDPAAIKEDQRWKAELSGPQKLWIRCLTGPVYALIRGLCRLSLGGPTRKDGFSQ